MENSIEEAIKVMEHWIEYEKNNKEKINRADELINIQETILSAYKRVLKEKNRLEEQVEYDKTHIYTPQTIELNFISKSKIEDKIEKLNSESYAEKLEDMMNIKNYTITELVQYVLQELLDGSDTDVGSIGNSIEEEIEILEKFKNNKIQRDKLERDVRCGGWKIGDIYKCLELDNAIDNILSDYKRVLKENERYKKSDYETICLENNELREITDRIQSEYNDLLKDNFKLKYELETKRKEYQETYKDVREELKELRKENEELRAKWDKDTHILQNKLDYANADRIDLAQQNKELRKENEELKNKLSLKQFDVNIVYNDYLEKLDEYERNNIPKSKLKDIIDRIDYDIKKTKEIISKNTNIYASYRKNDYQIVRLRAMNTKSLDIKNRLQKLLESEE